ncbi:MAG: MFS transporter [Clostridia bacterium]|nr:MFS transporter [Clostridia bacterium]
MLTTLFIVIFVSFIGIGLPDSVLGAAWPSMYRAFRLPISLAGYISFTVSVGTIVSSLMSAKLIRKFGTGLVTAGSTFLTAIAMLGFAYTKNPACFFLLAIPLGLGAGAIDTALNAFVVLHYNASKMNFLHCFYGIGVAASPLIMSMALGAEGNWRRGYLLVAIIELGIAAIAFLSLPLWHKVQKTEAVSGENKTNVVSLSALIKMPGVLVSSFAFFCSCALELTAGGWSSSYFVNSKCLPSDQAARITTLFYVGLAMGRFLSGIFANRVGRRKILRLSLVSQLLAILLFLCPFPTVVTAICLFFVGLSIGPVYPNLVHLTPQAFGAAYAEAVIGMQQAMTYLGIMLMPWLFGVLAQFFSTGFFPYYLLSLCLLYAGVFLRFMRTLQTKEKGGYEQAG